MESHRTDRPHSRRHPRDEGIGGIVTLSILLWLVTQPLWWLGVLFLAAVFLARVGAERYHRQQRHRLGGHGDPGAIDSGV